ncbi:Bug family tripartite tricarboxylate transporter substrate binding protein [Muricoccus radiodurans]|uniref:Bug family tripartite tricarboxylate transporter substrate binding protein n=1 Tax=Muricoccus radiodurans TaxID=2231721 RepID=UPI003CF95AFD
MIRLLAALLLLAGGTLPALAQVVPGRPIRVIVGYGPGSALETPARAIADQVGARLGTTLVFESRPGGGGVVGSEIVARAAPDGHTLVMGGAGSHGVTPAIKRRLPFNMERDFTAIARIAEFPVVMMVSPSLPVRTLQEFIALAKARPGQLNFGSSGVGTSLHLTGELLRLRTGIDVIHVPYRGSTGVSTALMAGEVQISFDALPAIVGLVTQGSIRALAVTTAARLPELPDVPTTAEAGLPDFVVTSWVGPFGPAGMSPATVEQLSRAFTEAALSPEGSARLRAIGATPVGEGPAAFDAFWRRDMARWQEVVQAAHVPVEDY